MPLQVCLDLADSLRLAAERTGAVQQRIMIELDERLERDAEPLAIIQNRAVMIRNAPGPRIEIEPFLKAAGLGRTTQFGKTVAAAQRPVAPTETAVELQHLNLVARRAQLERGCHPGETRAEDQHGGALDIALQPDRSVVGRLRCKP